MVRLCSNVNSCLFCDDYIVDQDVVREDNVTVVEQTLVDSSGKC